MQVEQVDSYVVTLNEDNTWPYNTLCTDMTEKYNREGITCLYVVVMWLGGILKKIVIIVNMKNGL